jgi:hypothetical protein
VRLVRQLGRDYVPSLDASALAEVINQRAPRVGLIIVETVSRAGGDESNPAMSALVSAAEELSALTRSAVLLVAHVSKAAAREGTSDQFAARGGGAITDNGRFNINATLLEKDKERDVRDRFPGLDDETKARLFTLSPRSTARRPASSPSSSAGRRGGRPSPWRRSPRAGARPRSCARRRAPTSAMSSPPSSRGSRR